MNCKESLLQSTGSCCSLDSLIEFPAVLLLVLSSDMQTMSACYALDRKKGKTEIELLLDSLLFQLALLKGPPSQVQLERSIYLQCVITLSFLL